MFVAGMRLIFSSDSQHLRRLVSLGSVSETSIVGCGEARESLQPADRHKDKTDTDAKDELKGQTPLVSSQERARICSQAAVKSIGQKAPVVIDLRMRLDWKFYLKVNSRRRFPVRFNLGDRPTECFVASLTSRMPPYPRCILATLCDSIITFQLLV
jgi:hypothetical protein